MKTIVYLSRRNLEVLLAKLDRNKQSPGESKCTIEKNDDLHPVYPMKAGTLITAIENEEYYSDRCAGEMITGDALYVERKEGEAFHAGFLHSAADVKRGACNWYAIQEKFRKWLTIRP